MASRRNSIKRTKKIRKNKRRGGAKLNVAGAVQDIMNGVGCKDIAVLQVDTAILQNPDLFTQQGEYSQELLGNCRRKGMDKVCLQCGNNDCKDIHYRNAIQNYIRYVINTP